MDSMMTLHRGPPSPCMREVSGTARSGPGFAVLAAQPQVPNDHHGNVMTIAECTIKSRTSLAEPSQRTSVAAWVASAIFPCTDALRRRETSWV